MDKIASAIVKNINWIGLSMDAATVSTAVQHRINQCNIKLLDLRSQLLDSLEDVISAHSSELDNSTKSSCSATVYQAAVSMATKYSKRTTKRPATRTAARPPRAIIRQHQRPSRAPTANSNRFQVLSSRSPSRDPPDSFLPSMIQPAKKSAGNAKPATHAKTSASTKTYQTSPKNSSRPEPAAKTYQASPKTTSKPEPAAKTSEPSTKTHGPHTKTVAGQTKKRTLPEEDSTPRSQIQTPRSQIQTPQRQVQTPQPTTNSQTIPKTISPPPERPTTPKLFSNRYSPNHTFTLHEFLELQVVSESPPSPPSAEHIPSAQPPSATKKPLRTTQLPQLPPTTTPKQPSNQPPPKTSTPATPTTSKPTHLGYTPRSCYLAKANLPLRPEQCQPNYKPPQKTQRPKQQAQDPRSPVYLRSRSTNNK